MCVCGGGGGGGGARAQGDTRQCGGDRHINGRGGTDEAHAYLRGGAFTVNLARQNNTMI